MKSKQFIRNLLISEIIQGIQIFTSFAKESFETVVKQSRLENFACFYVITYSTFSAY